MDAFRVRVLAAGKVTQQAVEAASETDVRARFAAQGAVVLEVRRDARFGRRRRAPKFALALFLQELSTLLDAGLVLIEALEALRDKADSGRDAKHVIDRILAVMVEGQPLSKALAQQPAIFPPLLVATIESSEGSGQLPLVLKRYQQYEVRIEQVRKRVIGALIYPAVVIGVGIAILLFMAFFVIPRFAVVFESLATLPATARAMLWWANLLREDGMAVGLAVAASFAGAALAAPVAGLEFAGQVTEVGAEVVGVKPGDRVMAMGQGAFAEFARIDYRLLPLEESRRNDFYVDMRRGILEPAAAPATLTP